MATNKAERKDFLINYILSNRGSSGFHLTNNDNIDCQNGVFGINPTHILVKVARLPKPAPKNDTPNTTSFNDPKETLSQKTLEKPEPTQPETNRSRLDKTLIYWYFIHYSTNKFFQNFARRPSSFL